MTELWLFSDCSLLLVIWFRFTSKFTHSGCHCHTPLAVYQVAVDWIYGFYFYVDLEKKYCRFGDVLFFCRCRFGLYFAIDFGIFNQCVHGDFDNLI